MLHRTSCKIPQSCHPNFCNGVEVLAMFPPANANAPSQPGQEGFPQNNSQNMAAAMELISERNNSFSSQNGQNQAILQSSYENQNSEALQPNVAMNCATVDGNSDVIINALSSLLSSLCEQQGCGKRECMCPNPMPTPVICKRIPPEKRWKPKRPKPYKMQCFEDEQQSFCSNQSRRPFLVPNQDCIKIPLMKCKPPRPTICYQCESAVPQSCGCMFVEEPPSPPCSCCNPCPCPYPCPCPCTCFQIRQPKKRKKVRPATCCQKPMLLLATAAENQLGVPPLILSVKGAVMKCPSISSFFINPPHQLHSYRCQTIQINQKNSTPTSSVERSTGTNRASVTNKKSTKPKSTKKGSKSSSRKTSKDFSKKDSKSPGLKQRVHTRPSADEIDILKSPQQGSYTLEDEEASPF